MHVFSRRRRDCRAVNMISRHQPKMPQCKKTVINFFIMEVLPES